MEQPSHCPIYGCKRSRNRAEQTVTVQIDGQTRSYVVCDFHYEMFQVMDPAAYSIGFTYTGEPEIRLHPVVPALPIE